MRGKPILLIDFDGVIHSYKSGWKGARCIPDEPVPGAINFLVMAIAHFDVCIYSARSSQWGGRRAMKKWLRKWFFNIADYEQLIFGTSEWRGRTAIWGWVESHWGMEPHPHDKLSSARALVRAIRFPLTKPAAFLTIDDRCVQFNGTFADPKELLSFQPWTNKGV